MRITTEMCIRRGGESLTPEYLLNFLGFASLFRDGSVPCQVESKLLHNNQKDEGHQRG